MLLSFLRYIEHEKRYSPQTITSYRTDLTQYSDFLLKEHELHSPEEATFGLIRSWVVSLVEAEMSSATINRKIASLRSFYKFLLRKAVIKKDPTLKLKAPKVKKSLPIFVEEQNLYTLFDQAIFESDFEGQRDKLILELLYGTGMRLSELIDLKHADVSTYDQTIKVMGKGHKERVIPINKSLQQSILSYYEKKRETGHNTSGSLIVTNTGDSTYPMFIYRTVKKYLNLVTSVEKKSPHVLRHSFATHLLNKGADLNAIKELLGHSSLAATQVYTHNSLDKLKTIFNQAHPKA